MVQNKVFTLILGLAFFLMPQLCISKVPHSLLALGPSTFYSDYAVLVDKTARRTSVWKKRDSTFEKVKEYISDQGKRDGDKMVLGDHRTPEGVYYFQDLYEGANLPFDKYGVRAFTSNYPNLFDLRLGKTGSGIWLHAIPDAESLERGSRGCVVIRNKDIIEISKFIELKKTPFIITDKIQTVSPKEQMDNARKMENFLGTWRDSWQNEQLDEYMKHYSKNKFYAQKKNWNQWKSYKQTLNDAYKSIQVQLSKPSILRYKNKYIVKFLQYYASDNLQDYGEKTLHIVRDDQNQYKIIAEGWKSVRGPEIEKIISQEACCQSQVTSNTF